MTIPDKHLHPMHGELYTPMSQELMDLFERMKIEHGSYRQVCHLVRMRMKVYRTLRRGKRKAVSMTILDRMITATEVGRLEDFEWYTPDQLVSMGIWKPTQYVAGRKRYRLENEQQNKALQEDAD